MLSVACTPDGLKARSQGSLPSGNMIVGRLRAVNPQESARSGAGRGLTEPGTGAYNHHNLYDEGVTRWIFATWGKLA